VLAMLPPLWFALMHPRIEALPGIRQQNQEN
jgi:hypothetical protein